jgi:hypothetical protein
MSHSLIGADRTTHLKVICVSLIAAIAVIAVGITARATDSDQTRVVLKANKPAVYTARDAATIR